MRKSPVMFFIILLAMSFSQKVFSADPWFDSTWRYRIKVEVATGYAPRPAAMSVKEVIDFGEYLSSAGLTGSVDQQSIRVTDSHGVEVPHDVLRWIEPDKAMVRWQLGRTGFLEGNASFTYYVYFDLLENGLKRSVTSTLAREFALVSGSDDGDGLYLGYSKGDGSFGDWQVIRQSGDWDNFCIADLDNDGDYDFAAVGESVNGVDVFYNGGQDSGQFFCVHFSGVDTTWGAIREGDFNEDGWIDLAYHGRGKFHVLMNRGDGYFVDHPVDDALGSVECSSIGVGDINGDGHMDIILGYSDRKPDVFWGDGAGHFSLEEQQDFLPDIIDAHGLWVWDYDSDGDTDIILASSSDAWVYTNNGQSQFTKIREENLSEIDSGGGSVWDWNNDGNPDVTRGRWSATGKLFMYCGTGNPEAPLAPSREVADITGIDFGGWHMNWGGLSLPLGMGVTTLPGVERSLLTLSPPEGQWAVKSGDFLRVEGQFDSGVTLEGAMLVDQDGTEIADVLTGCNVSEDGLLTGAFTVPELAPGVTSVRLKVTLSGTTEVESNDLPVDEVLPELVILNPSDGANFPTHRVRITGRAQDGTGSGIKEVSYSTDNGVSWKVIDYQDVMVDPEPIPLAESTTNIALSDNGGHIIDRSSNLNNGPDDGDWGASNLIDGVVADNSADGWATDNEGAGLFVRIGFDGPYVIDSIALANRIDGGKNQDIALEFSDGSTQSITLSNDATLQYFQLDPVETEWVKITVDSVYEQNNNGFQEIKIYSPSASGIDSEGTWFLTTGVIDTREVLFRCTDGAGNQAQETISLAQKSEALQALITMPLSRSIINYSPVDIIGRASGGENFFRYDLSYIEGADNRSETGWDILDLDSPESPVEDGLLGTWDISSLEDGDFTIKLRVESTSGEKSTVYRTLTIDRQAPPGPDFSVTLPEGFEGVKTGDVVELSGQATPGSSNPKVQLTDESGSPLIRGDQFIICAGDEGKIYYVSNNLDGTFDLGPTGYGYHLDTLGAIKALQVADFTWDGLLDFMVADESLYLFKQIATGQFEKLLIDNEAGTAVGMCAGDFDRDGDNDLAVFQENQTAYFYRNDGNDQFTKSEPFVSPGENYRGAASGDFDGDGFLDVVVAQSPSGMLYLFSGNGDCTFSSPTGIADLGDDPYGVTAGDFDNDGLMDVIASEGAGRQIWFLKGLGTGEFEDKAKLMDIDLPCGLSNADLDFDGKLDLVLVNYNGGQLYWYRGSGNGAFGPAALIGTPGGSNMAVGTAPLDYRIDSVNITRSGNIQADIKVLSGIRDGNIQVQLSVFDEAGNESTPATSEPLAVDNIEPEVSITRPGEFSYSDSNLTIEGVTQDEGVGIKEVLISVDGGDTFPYLASGTTSWKITIEDLPDGTYDVVARAVDLAGNVADSEPVKVTCPHVMGPWFDSTWRYRIKVEVATGYAPRPAAMSVKEVIDFGEYLSSAGLTGSVDQQSIRVTDSHGVEVPHDVLRWIEPDKAMVRWQLGRTGFLEGNASFTYYVYFDLLENGLKRSVTSTLAREFALVSGSDDGDGLYLGYSKGDGSFGDWQVIRQSGDWDNFCIADLDNDGDYDFAAVGESVNGVDVFYNGGQDSGQFFCVHFSGVDTTWGAIREGDFNEDGWIDLAYHGRGKFHVLMNRGDGYFVDHPVDDALGSVECSSIGVGDINGDGHMDIILGYSDRKPDVFWGDGAGHFSLEEQQDFLPDIIDAHGLWVWDYDSDGDTDIILASSSDAWVYTNNGQSQFTKIREENLSEIDSGGGSVWDWNNDGNPDVTRGRWSATGKLFMYCGTGNPEAPLAPSREVADITGIDFGGWHMNWGGLSLPLGMGVTTLPGVERSLLTLSPPEGQWAVKSGDFLRVEGQFDSGVTLEGAMLVDQDGTEIADVLTGCNVSEDGLLTGAFTVPELAPGVTSVRLKVTLSGTTEVESNDLPVDEVLPELVILNPSDGANFPTHRVRITGRAQDGTGSGIKEVSYSTDNGVSWKVIDYQDVMVDPEPIPLAESTTNIALSDNGGHIIDRSSNLNNGPDDGDWGASNLIDGVVADNSADGWATDNEGAGLFVRIGFDGPYVIDSIALANRIDGGKNQDIALEFSDGSTQSITLSNDATLQYFQLDPVETEWVKITVDSVYEQNNNGFQEIKIYSPSASGIDSEGTWFLTTGVIDTREVLFRCTDGAGNQAQETISLAQKSEALQALITMPLSRSIINYSPVDIIGRASGGENFFRYDLSYIEGADNRSETGWDILDLDSPESPVEDGLLGTWDISSLEDGDFTIKLRVESTSGEKSTVYRTLTIDRQAPPGPDFSVTLPEGFEGVKTGDVVELSGQATPGSSNPKVQLTDESGSPLIRGDQFIICAGDEGKIYYVSNNLDGTFDLGPTGYGYHLDTLGAIKALQVADFTWDGLLDFMVADESLYLFKQIATGQFEKLLIDNEAGTAVGMCAGDFDRDGDNDLAVFQENQTAYFYRNDGNDQFTKSEPFVSPGENYRGAASGDFDGDGFLDVVVAQSPSGMLYLFSGNGDCTFSSPTGIADLGDDPYGVTAGDFDNDGLMDVIASEGAGRQIWFLKGLGTGEFEDKAKLMDIDLPCGLSNADLDFDGKLDLVLVNYNGGQLYWYRGSGNGAFGPAALIGTPGGSNMAVGTAPLDYRIDSVNITRSGNIQADIKVLSGIRDGNIQVQLSVFDEAGNESTPATSEPLAVDNIEPEVSITRPGEFSYSDSNLTIEGVTQDEGVGIKEVLISVDGGDTFPYLASGTTSWKITIEDLPDGTYDVVARAVDLAGNVADSEPVKVKCEYQGLIVDIVYPGADDQILPIRTVEIKGTASGINFTRYCLKYSRKNEDAWEIIYESKNLKVKNDVLGSWNTKELDGDYTLRLEVDDSRGYRRTIERDVKVDSVLPETPLDLVAESLPRGIIRLTWSEPQPAEDEEVPQRYYIYRRPAGTQEELEHVGAAVQTLSWEDMSTQDGVKYEYVIAGVDKATNISKMSNSAEATADKTPPSLNILSPEGAPYFNHRLTITGTAADTGSGLDALLLSHDGGQSWNPSRDRKIEILHISPAGDNLVEQALQNAGVPEDDYIYQITRVSRSEFDNHNPADLSAFDVIVFGIQDQGLNPARQIEIKTFVENGGGVIWTHDTLEYETDLGPLVEVPAGVDYDCDSPTFSGTQVQIVSDHDILNYPFQIGELNDILSVFNTGTSGGRTTSATKVMAFTSENIEDPCNFYLTVNEYGQGRVVVQEIGNSNAGTEAEYKILANAIWWASGWEKPAEDDFKIAFEQEGLPEGEYQLFVKAVDRVGNEQMTQSAMIVTYDVTPPEADDYTIIYPKAGGEITPDLTLTISIDLNDAVNNREQVQQVQAVRPDGQNFLLLDNGQGADDNEGDHVYSGKLPVNLTESEGQEFGEVWVTVRDRAGNVTFLSKDIAPPILINRGKTLTKSEVVSLNISAANIGGAAAAYVTETDTEPAAEAEGWIPLQAEADFNAYSEFTFSLDGQEEQQIVTKTVYVWFKDDSGNVFFGGSDDINLDKRIFPSEISGEPESPTNKNYATLVVTGTGIVKYMFRVDSGDWSDEIAITEPIVLTELDDGEHFVEVIGGNEAGDWQKKSHATRSKTWVVDTESPYVSLKINEGHEHTCVPDVVLDIGYVDERSFASFMMLSNDPDFTGASWIPYQETMEWTLSGDPGPEPKKVYAKVKDAAGNPSSVVFDDILWDCFPDDPAASRDSDQDGYPDDWEPGKSRNDSTTGLILDAFPQDSAAALDTDGDGMPDAWNQDASQEKIDASPLTIDDDDDNDGIPDDGDSDPLMVDADNDGYRDPDDGVANYSLGVLEASTIINNRLYVILSGEDLQSLGGTEANPPPGLTFALDQTSIDKGMVIDDSGVITWEPDFWVDKPESHQFCVTASSFGGALAVVKALEVIVTNPKAAFEGKETPIESGRMYYAHINNAGDIDDYRFTVSDPAVFRIEFLPESGIGADDTLIEIVDHADNTIASYTSVDGAYILLDAKLSEGEYVIRVTSIADFDEQFMYGLLCYPVADFFEDFDGEIDWGTTQSRLRVNVTYKDRYTFSFEEPHYVKVKFEADSYLHEPFYLIDSSGENDFEGLRVNPREPSEIKYFLPAGKYQISIGKSVSGIGPMTYSLRLDDMGLAELEPNDTLTTASKLPINQAPDQVKLWAEFTSEADVDYYEINIEKPVSIDIALQRVDGQNYDMELIFCGESIYRTTNEPLKIALYPGKFYLKVTGAPGLYSLDAYSVLEVREFEPNDRISYANTMTKDQHIKGSLYSNQDKDVFGFYQKEYIDTFILNVSSSEALTVTVMDVSGNIHYHKPVYNDTIYVGIPKGDHYIVLTAEGYCEYSISTDSDIGLLNRLIKVEIKGDAKIDVGETKRLKFLGYYLDGTEKDHTSDAAWTLSKEGNKFIEIEKNGDVTGLLQGEVTIYAEYKGMVDQLTLSVSQDSRNVQHYGNLILVAGGGMAATNTLKESYQYLSDLVYRRFQQRLFTDEDIYYFNPMTWHDIDGDGYNDDVVDDSSPTVAEFGQAITRWAAEQKTDGPLYIYLIDHGGTNTFTIFPDEVITANQLAGYLGAFQDTTGRQVIVMIEACKSGSFTDDLVTPGKDRIVVTCTDDKNAYIHLTGRISFTQFFVDSLLTGDSIYESYLKAWTELSNSGLPYSEMRPQLEEGISLLSYNRHVGGAFGIASLFPEIIEQSPNTIIDLKETPDPTQVFYVQMSESEEILKEIEDVWAVVLTPDYLPPSTSKELEAPQVHLPTFELTDQNRDGRFEGEYGNFTYNGDYRITFYVRNTNGIVTASPATVITVTGGDNVISLKGDVNRDFAVNLADAIISLQVISKKTQSGRLYHQADVNGDGKIGLAEVVYIMRKVAAGQ